MRTAMLDIEATNLSADFGRVLCVCLKPLGGPITTIRQDQTEAFKRGRKSDDREVVRAAFREMAKYDVLVTYYGKGYDIPFLRTRGLMVPHRPIVSCYHIDLYPYTKYQFRFSRRSLAKVQEYMSLEEKKTPLTPKVWQDAAAGDPKAYKPIVDHCQQDVKVLESVFDAYRPLLKTLTRVVI